MECWQLVVLTRVGPTGRIGTGLVCLCLFTGPTLCDALGENFKGAKNSSLGAVERGQENTASEVE